MKHSVLTARGRYAAAQAALGVIEEQAAEDLEGGIVRIQNAYSVQEVSGRLTFKRGGPQSLPKAMKQLAYDQPGLFNYDIKSSQTIGLRHLARELQQLRAGVLARPLDEYLGRGGKDWVVRRYGLPRRLVKRVEHAVKFGAAIPASLAQARALASMGYESAVADHVLRDYQRETSVDRVLGILRDVFGEIRAMIQEIAEHLLKTYWQEHRQSGGRGKGAFMRNACGMTFCPGDYAEGHARQSKAMAWYLQGLEAAFCHALTSIQEGYDYEILANEHDGVVARGAIPPSAIEEARALSGFEEAELAEKPFADSGDFEKIFGLGFLEELNDLMSDTLHQRLEREQPGKEDAPAGGHPRPPRRRAA